MHLILNILVNKLGNVIKYYIHLVVSDDIKKFRVITSSSDCTAPFSSTDSVRGWCAADFMKMKIVTTRSIPFSRENKVWVYDSNFAKLLYPILNVLKRPRSVY
jgi:hypothetical protein